MKRIVLVVVAAMLATACDVPGDDESSVIEGDWDVDRPGRTPIAPGQPLVLHLTGVDVSKSDLFVWMYDDALTIPPEKLDEGDVVGDGDVTLTLFTPFFRDGEYVIYLGDTEGHRSGAIEINVKVPAPRLSRGEAARLLATGIDVTIGQVEGMLAEPDEDWQAMWTSTYSAAERGSIDAMFTEMHRVGPKLEQMYNELSDEDEAAFQSYLEQRGILRDFEDGLAIIGNPTIAHHDGTTTIFDRANHMVSRGLYTLDLTSLIVGNAGDALTVVAIACAVIPGLQPISGISYAAELIPYAIKVVIDNFVPTDLYALSTDMVQTELYRGVGHRTYYWGTFGTETRTTQAAFSSFDNLIALEMEAFLGKKAKIFKEVTAEIVATIGAKLGLSLPTLLGFLPKDKAVSVRITAIVNMQLYSVTLGDLMVLVPMLQMFRSALYIIPDPELFDPFFAKPVDGDPLREYSEDVDIFMTYGTDTMYFESIDWPTTAPNQRADIYVSELGYRFTTTDFPWIISLPWLERVPEHNVRVRTRYAADPSDASSTTEDHALLITEFPGDPTYQGWFNTQAPLFIQVPIVLYDLAGGRPDVAKVNIVVNDVLKMSDVALIAGGGTVVTLELVRGRNTITFVGTEGHSIGYDANGQRWSIPLQFQVPNAVQTDKNRAKFLNVGDSGTTIIVTPPIEQSIPAED